MKENIRDLEDIRNTSDDVRAFRNVQGQIGSAEDFSVHTEDCACGCGTDHSHADSKHTPRHTHGSGSHQHNHAHEHEDSCGCGHDHGHNHAHEHEDSCGCGHDHGHAHVHGHHVPGHPADCQCEICHPHEEYCDVCGESLANCTCRMPDADKVKRVYILKNLGCANCAAKMEYKIKELPGVTYANISFVTKQLRLSAKNHEAILPEIRKICSSIESDVEVIPRAAGSASSQEGAHIYIVENLDCANCGAKIERALNKMPEIKEAVLTYTTKKLKVSASSYDGLLEKMQAVADSVEDGVVLKPVSGRVSRRNSRTYIVQNLDCANCGAKIERALNQMPEVNEAVLTFTTKKLRVSAPSYDGLLEKMQAVTDSVEDGVVLVEAEEMPFMAPSLEQRKKAGGIFRMLSEKESLLEIVIGGILFIAAEWLSIIPEEYHIYCLIIAYILLGGRIVAAALKNIVKGHVFDENFLMTVATLGAFAIKAWEEAVGVMFFYRLGEFFEQRAVEKSRGQIMDAVDMRPEVVNLLIGEEIKVIPAAEANVGDILMVRAGDRIPLDGVVIEGESLIDTSPVTGESVPVKKQYGDEVISGCVNTSGMLKIRVEKVLEESMVTKILDSVENAAASKPTIDRFITRFARVYTPFVVIAAVLTAVIPSLVTGDWSKWIYTALTFLVISCPCALVLSVPLAFFSGIGAGSKYGILFKGGVAMEALKNVAAVVMDKTGTITKGNFVLQEVNAAAGVDSGRLLQICAGAEMVSTHPIAVSIVSAAKEKNLELVRPSSFEEIAGEGLVAYCGNDKILCGNMKLMERCGVSCPGYREAAYGSEVLVAENGRYLGQLLINDTIKEDAKEAIAALKKQGLITAMLTGDAQREAQAVADAAGIDEVRAKLLPQDKLSELNSLRSKYGPVMFVGDGINDAPVLAGADTGAAMGSGADAAIEAADVVFMNSEVKAIPQAIAIAKATGAIAWQNVVFALIIKVLIMAAGLFGYASMWAAVFADTGVSLICVLNSIRILYKKV